MKDEQVHLKISHEEKSLLRKAARNLNVENGKKENVSAAIRHSIKKYAELDLTRPECYFIDRPAIKAIDRNVNFALIHLQKFCDEWKTVTGQNCTLEELQVMLAGIGSLGSQATIQNAITEAVTIKLHEQHCKRHPEYEFPIDQIKTGNLTTLFAIADTLNSKIPMPRIEMNSSIYWSCYSCTGNILSIILKEVEKLKDAHRSYASTPAELKRLAMVKKICLALNEALTDDDAKENPLKLLSAAYYDPESAKYEVTGAFVVYPLAPRMFI